MKLPSEVPVMTLPNATLFPQALLPLYIFEPRYRQMLLDSLHTDRMFSVAMQKPGRSRETPSLIAGLGLIRVSVGHNDGTSHLILQGIARVELEEAVRYKPYRIQRIRPLESPPCNELAVDALQAKVRELLEERVKLGLKFPPFPGMAQTQAGEAECDPPVTTRNVNRDPEADWATIRQNGLNMSDCRRGVSCQSGWVHHRDAAIQGKPDPPC